MPRRYTGLCCTGWVKKCQQMRRETKLICVHLWPVKDIFCCIVEQILCESVVIPELKALQKSPVAGVLNLIGWPGTRGSKWIEFKWVRGLGWRVERMSTCVYLQMVLSVSPYVFRQAELAIISNILTKLVQRSTNSHKRNECKQKKLKCK